MRGLARVEKVWEIFGRYKNFQGCLPRFRNVRKL